MKISAKLRQAVVKRAKGICEYCSSNSEFSSDPFEVEHIIPIAEGGKTVLANLALSCRGCNLHKSKRIVGFDILSEENVRFFNPRKDQREEHFVWSNDFTLIIGLTPIGRSTIEALKLNRQGLINQRQVLYLFGQHPPI